MPAVLAAIDLLSRKSDGVACHGCNMYAPGVRGVALAADGWHRAAAASVTVTKSGLAFVCAAIFASARVPCATGQIGLGGFD
jgi:hypothetical protein